MLMSAADCVRQMRTSCGTRQSASTDPPTAPSAELAPSLIGAIALVRRRGGSGGADGGERRRASERLAL